MRKLINFLGFQLVWFACVLTAAHGRPWLGLAVFAAVVALHLRLSPNRVAELKLLAAAAVVGALAESALLFTGVLRFPGAGLPLWMVALWVNFAATLRVALSWLAGRYALGAAVGAVAGPLAYLGGERLGAIAVQQPLGVALEWAIATPLLLWLAKETA